MPKCRTCGGLNLRDTRSCQTCEDTLSINNLPPPKPLKDRTPNALPSLRTMCKYMYAQLLDLAGKAEDEEDRAKFLRAAALANLVLTEIE